MAKTIEAKIDQLVPDDLNANKHSEYGMHLLEKSISTLGLGRSILVDKNNRIIGGNGVLETVGNLGMEDCIIVPTDGKKLVVVRRDDIDLDSKQGRELALADNATSKANLTWDAEVIDQITEQWEVKTEDWGINLDNEDLTPKDPFEDEGIAPQSKYGVIVMCASELEQEKTFVALQELGYTCKVVVV